MKKSRTQKDNIIICRCKTRAIAAEMERLLNEGGVGVTAEGNRVMLHQSEAERPYPASMIECIRKLCQSWNKLLNWM